MNDTSANQAGGNPQADDQGTVVSQQQVGKYTVKVINEKCIGAASCVAIAPGTYVLNEQNIAEIISQNGDSDEMKLLGAQSCPTAAVIVTDNETGEQVWPIE
jgi:ferredoxin